MKSPYYLVDDSKCLAYVEELSYFIFWRRWYWNVKFYVEDNWLPCDTFDGFAKTESQARDTVTELYKGLLEND